MGQEYTKQQMAQHVATRLVGGCTGTIADELEFLKRPELEDDAEFLSLLDNEIFCCDHCEWWCGTDERNECGDKFVCDDCSLDEFYEDEEDE